MSERRRARGAGGALTLALLASCAGDGADEGRTHMTDDPRSERREERERMVQRQLAARDITDPRVLAAMRAVPRHRFVPEDLRAEAYGDHPLPIEAGQTISQPYVVAWMTQALDLQPDEKVLEIGTGSGYQGAVLAELTPHVWTIEIVPELGERAARTFRELGYDNIHARVGDGYRGWPEAAPFDAIVVTAAPGFVPPALVEQLAVGGRLVLPVGGQESWQELQQLTKQPDGSVVTEDLGAVRFVPMTGIAERPVERALTMTRRHEGFEHLLTRVAFFDGALGLAVGGDREQGTPGLVLRTSDGGATWERRESGVERRLYGVAFASADVALAAGLGGTLLRSADGGRTWDPVASGTDAWLADVAFVDAERALVAGTGDGGAVLLRSDDGGAGFARVELPEPGRGGLRSLAVHGELALAVGDQGRILRSADGGASWADVDSGTDAWLRAVRRGPDGAWRAAGSGGVLLESADEGRRWRRVPTQVTDKWSDVCFLDARQGLLVSMEGRVHLTLDGGASWRVAHELDGADLACLAPLDEGRAFLVGDGLLAELALRP